MPDPTQLAKPRFDQVTFLPPQLSSIDDPGVQLLGVERPENSPASHGKLPSDGQRRAAGIIFYGNGSAGATGRRCRYKLAASGGSAGCVRQLQAPIWVTPMACGYKTAKNRGIFATLRL